jgi:spermidine synthase
VTVDRSIWIEAHPFMVGGAQRSRTTHQSSPNVGHAVKKWIEIARAPGPEGRELLLQRRDEEVVIRIGGVVLMTSRTHGSEEAMAEAALGDRRSDAVLVGGLGLGFTLRAVLDRGGPRMEVTVAELLAPVIAWNRGPVAELAARPLDDSRVTVFEGDVRAVVRRSPEAFDAILLDVDNGPQGLTRAGNAELYGRRGLEELRAALRPKGRLVVWSAGPDARFEQRLVEAGFSSAGSRPVPARKGAGGQHVLFLATR